jgi:hypothetical protein
MKNLMSALIKFQKEVPTIVKDKSNPFFKSKYSDLASVINGVSETLGKCELAVFHKTRIQDNRNVLVTILAHSSGEFIEAELFIPEQSDPQKLGSLFTYLKRYSYMAILGIASQDEDDDAHHASSSYRENKPAPKQEPIGTEFPPTEKQKDLIKFLSEKLGKPYVDAKTFKHASDLINRLKELEGEKPKSAGENKFKI